MAQLEVRETNTRSVELSRDGESLLVVTKGDSLLRYTDPWDKPTRVRLSDTLVSAGQLADGRVFAADRVHLEFFSAALTEKLGAWALPSHEPNLPQRRVALSPNGRFLGIDDAVYDLEAGRWIMEPLGHAHQTALAFAGNERVLTAGFHDGRVAVRALATGKTSLWQSPGRVVSAAITDAGDAVVIATEDRIILWKPPNKAPSRETSCRDATALQICANEQKVVALCGQVVQAFDRFTLKSLSQLDLETKGLVISCQGSLVAVGDEAGNVYAWDLGSTRVWRQESLRSPISALAVSQTTRRIFATADDAQGTQGLLLHAK